MKASLLRDDDAQGVIFDSEQEVSPDQLAKVLRCETQTVRKYAQQKVIRRTGRGRYPLFASIGNVVEHYRQLAARHGTADAMRANVELKEAQRRLTDLRYDQLRGELISMPDIESLWTDLVRSAKWLFLSLPGRARFEMPHLTDDDLGGLERICQTMLTELTLRGDPPLPSASSEQSDDDQDDDAGDDEPPAPDAA